MHSLENFDDVINKWLAVRLNKEKYKVNAAILVRDEYKYSLTVWETGISKTKLLPFYKSIYREYCKGDIKAIYNLIENDNSIATLFSNEEQKALIKTKELKNINKRKRSVGSYTPPPIYKFTDNNIKNELSKALRDYIFTREIINKLNHILLPSTPDIFLNKIEELLSKYKNKIGSGNNEQNKNGKVTNLDTDPKTKLFPKMKLSYAKNFFKILTTEINKNGMPFLTEDELNIFLEKAFMLNKSHIQKLQFNYVNTEKTKIKSLFYIFYQKSLNDELVAERNNDLFIKLLTENFLNWNYNVVKNNFSRRSKFVWNV